MVRRSKSTIVCFDMKKLLLLLFLSLGFIGPGLTASTADIVETNILKLKAVNICLGIRCDLTEADLSGANLSGANLSRADLIYMGWL